MVALQVMNWVKQQEKLAPYCHSAATNFNGESCTSFKQDWEIYKQEETCWIRVIHFNWKAAIQWVSYDLRWKRVLQIHLITLVHGKSVVLQWIPLHCKIMVNDIADMLGKKGFLISWNKKQDTYILAKHYIRMVTVIKNYSKTKTAAIDYQWTLLYKRPWSNPRSYTQNNRRKI